MLGTLFTIEETIPSEPVPPLMMVNFPLLPRSELIEGGNDPREVTVKNYPSRDHMPLACVTNQVEHLVND